MFQRICRHIFFAALIAVLVASSFLRTEIAPVVRAYVELDGKFNGIKLAGDSPNKGLSYVTVVFHADWGGNYFKYEITPHVEEGREFYNAQCGHSGYISGAVLRANGYEHESGTQRGHYQQYRDKLADPAVNFAKYAEPRIGPVAQNYQAFADGVVDAFATRKSSCTPPQVSRRATRTSFVSAKRGDLGFLRNWRRSGEGTAMNSRLSRTRYRKRDGDSRTGEPCSRRRLPRLARRCCARCSPANAPRASRSRKRLKRRPSKRVDAGATPRSGSNWRKCGSPLSPDFIRRFATSPILDADLSRQNARLIPF
jgi:hypothetical protein